MENRPRPLFSWWWSVDAPLVAVAWQAAFGKGYDVPIRWWAPWLLGLCVWLVYVADRLFDARRLDLARPHTPRHRFYHRHASRFAAAVPVAAAIVLALACGWCGRREWWAGAGVGALVVLYGVGTQRRPPGDWARRGKECFAGTLFALGTTAVIWCRQLSASLLVAVGMAAALFVGNCLLVAWWERRYDAAQEMPSLPLAWPGIGRWLPAGLAVLATAAWWLGYRGYLPMGLAWSLALAALGLLGLAILRVLDGKCWGGLSADLVVFLPAAMWAWLGDG